MASDDFEAADAHLRQAANIHPDAAELIDALEQFATLRVSAEQFFAAETLQGASDLLQARQAYLLVAPEDRVRYQIAMERAHAIERDWVDQMERLVKRQIEDRDLPAIAQAVGRAKRSLPESELLHTVIGRFADEIASVASEVARERLAGQDFGGAELALRTVEPTIPADALTAAARIEDARTAIALERERRDRERQEEALARQRSALVQSPARPSPRLAAPPAIDLPGTAGEPGGRECPSPTFGVEAWRRCVFGNETSPGPAVPGADLPATVTGPDGRECPSPVVDVEGWRECVFGSRSVDRATPPSSGPTPPSVPDSASRDASRDAAQRAALTLELRAREERALLEYQRLFAADSAATIDFQRRVRDFDREIQRLQDAGELGASAIEMMRKQDYVRTHGADQRRLRERIAAAERELAAIRAELERLS